MKLSSLLLGTCLANYNPYTIPLEDSHMEWVDPDNFLNFLEHEGSKEFVQYQAPDDEYVPIQDLPIVYLNGIKFRRQGKNPRPGTLERFQKLTRTNEGKLLCQDAELVKEQKEERKLHFQEEKKPKAAAERNDMQFDFVGALFQTKYPRYNGRNAPLPYDELEHTDLNLADLEPESEEEEMIHENPTLDLSGSDPVQGGVVSEVFKEPEDDDAVIMQLDIGLDADLDMEPQNEEERALTREALRLKRLKNKFYEQEKTKIGCCNGTPYNVKKRCCCRRVSFDKDKKFCCAINGCESFQIFDRSNAQHYKDCLSLSGLVIQEYGYHGQKGQPKADWATGTRRPGPGK